MDSSQYILLGFMIFISVIGLGILSYAIITIRRNDKRKRKNKE